MEIIRAVKYRIYPTTEQRGKLEWTFRRCCELYNAALEQRIIAYKKFGITLTKYTQDLELKHIKEEHNRPEYKDINSQVLKNVLTRLDNAYKGFFARVKKGEGGFPKFQGSRFYNSITYPTKDKHGIQGVKFVNGKLRLQAVGEVRMKMHQPLEGELRTLTIKKDVDKWYAIFVIKVPEPEHLPIMGRVVGIDLGLKDFITLSNGKKVKPLKAFKEAEAGLRIAQRKVARRVGGRGIKSSNRREKAKVIVQKWHQRVREQRRDYHYQTVASLVKAYDVICVEDLNIKGLASGMLAKSVNDAAWGMFVNHLERKCKELGRTFVKVNPRNTSKTCHCCGYIYDLELKDRTWQCPSCNESHDRDINAAKNVLALGLAQLQGSGRTFSRERRALAHT